MFDLERVNENINIIGDLNAWSKTHQRPWQLRLRWVSDEACRGLWWSISVFDGSPTRHIGFLCISDNNNFFVNSSWTRCVQDDWSIHIIYRFNPRSGDEDEDAEPENCAAPLTCKEKDLLRYYYYIHNGIATKYVAGNMNCVDTGTKESPRRHEILISLLPIYTTLIKTKYRHRLMKFNKHHIFLFKASFIISKMSFKSPQVVFQASCFLGLPMPPDKRYGPL